jgi:hypothetical protein
MSSKGTTTPAEVAIYCKFLALTWRLFPQPISDRRAAAKHIRQQADCFAKNLRSDVHVHPRVQFFKALLPIFENAE